MVFYIWLLNYISDKFNFDAISTEHEEKCKKGDKENKKSSENRYCKNKFKGM